MSKGKGAMTVEEILAADERNRVRNPRSTHGISKHRKARVEKYVHKNKKKRKR